MPTLTLPDAKYKASYIAAVKEYQAEDQANYRDLDVSALEEDFDTYIEKVKGEASGQNLPPGYVPHTVFWLVEGEEYIGRVDVRHSLNDFLHKIGGHIGYDVRPTQRRKGYGTLELQLGLQKAQELGLKEVLITCDVGNVASNKIIRENGGVFEKTVGGLTAEGAKNRYWYTLGE